MHISDVKAFAERVVADKAYGGKNTCVLLWADPNGTGEKMYLSYGRDGTKERAKARRFFYDDDKVSESLRTLALQGMIIHVDAVKAGETFIDPNSDEYYAPPKKARKAKAKKSA